MNRIQDLANAAAEEDDQTREVTPPSRPINWFLWVDYPEFDEALNELVEDIETSEGRSKKRTSRVRSQLKNAVKALALDLYVAWNSDPELQLGISRDKNVYGDTKHYDGLTLSYSAVVIGACDGLERLGYLRTAMRGFYIKENSGGKVTRILATEKLISFLNEKAKLTLFAIRDWDGLEVIVLKDTEKKRIPFRPNNFTKTASKTLRDINKLLSETWIDVNVTDDEFRALKKRQSEKHLDDENIPPSVNFSSRSLRRIFNNASWDQGGRFYGGWWQTIPSEYRQHIHINGKATVELDYSGMHPAMLYAEVEEQPPSDPYDMGLDRVSRKIKKVAFNALVNASSSRINAHTDYDPERSGLTWKELLEVIESRHPLISQYFRSGYGLQLQKKDADIAERVMLDFVDMGYPCLPVHDSFIVHHALADELQASMERAFEEMVRLPAKVDAKTMFEYKAPAIPHEADMGDIESILDGGEYRGYEKRRREWSAYIGRLIN